MESAETYVSELVDSLLSRAGSCDKGLLHLIIEDEIEKVQERNRLIVLLGCSQGFKLLLVKGVQQ